MPNQQGRNQRVGKALDVVGVPDDYAEYANLVDDMGMDELDIVEFIMALEVEFDIEIPDDIWGLESPAKIRTLGDVYALIERLVEPMTNELDIKLSLARTKLQVARKTYHMAQKAREDAIAARLAAQEEENKLHRRSCEVYKEFCIAKAEFDAVVVEWSKVGEDA